MTLRERLERVTWVFRTRAALGVRPLAAPVMIFIPLGVLLGPQAAAVLSPTALAHLDIVISIALATLGVVVGIAAGREAGAAMRLFIASTVEACVTMIVVAGAVGILLQTWQVPVAMPVLLVSLALGICAAASAAYSVDVGDPHARQVAARVADLDDVAPILLGGMVLAIAGSGPAREVGEATWLTIGLGLSLGVTGWLLVEGAAGGAERGVFVLGSLALLGGATAYLGLSPLLAGLAAGILWVVAPGRCDVIVARELRKVQHPLIVLLLVIAGASLEPTTAGIWLLAPYVIFRCAGKIVGGWTAARMAPAVAPSDLGAYLIPPGVIGIAFALNVAQVAPDAATSLVFAVSAGAIASEALAIVVAPARQAA
ncbi:MAG TPA: hypothetical protein VD833_08040 [Vicinamibacterales bacterium]|nr:hypothetical protein [Vicinamibacterales bacterium]